MSGWIKAINPTATSTTETEARRAARASALSIGLGVLMGLWSTYYMMTDGKAVMEAAMAEATAATPEAAGMMGAMASVMLGFGIAMVVVQAILGLVQWFKPNIVIPIIFTVLVVYGIGSMALSQMMVEQSQMTVPSVPLWQTIVTWVVLVVQLILHIAGIRGASALSQLRKA